MKSLLFLVIAAAAIAAPPAYKVTGKIKIGGPGRWDYVYIDSANHRLYVSHGTQTEVVDTATEKVVGTIMGTGGVHGIAIANDLNRGFTSDGTDNDVTIFDLKTLAVLGKVKTGTNPDAIIYEPVTHRVFTLNGRSNDSTVFEAKNGEIVAASIPVGGKPEFAQVDGKGHVYFNLEDKNEIGELDAKNATLTKHYSIAPCDGPSGLAINPKTNYLYSVCGNKMMVVSDPATGKVIATPEDRPGTTTALRSMTATPSARTAATAISRWSAKPRPANSNPWPRSRHNCRPARLDRTRRRTSSITAPAAGIRPALPRPRRRWKGAQADRRPFRTAS